MKTILYILAFTLLTSLRCFQIPTSPENEIGKTLPVILSQNEKTLSLIGHSDSTLKYIDPDTEIIEKYYLKENKCYKIEIYYQNTTMNQVAKKYFMEDWVDESMYHFNKKEFKMVLTERSNNFPVATITRK